MNKLVIIKSSVAFSYLQQIMKYLAFSECLAICRRNLASYEWESNLQSPDQYMTTKKKKKPH